MKESRKPKVTGSSSIRSNEQEVQHFKIEFKGKEIVTILAGVILFFLLTIFMSEDSKSLLRAKPSASVFMTLAKYMSFTSLLIYVLLAAIFGRKGSSNDYEFDKKFSFLKPILYFAVITIFVSIGVLIGLLFFISSRNV